MVLRDLKQVIYKINNENNISMVKIRRICERIQQVSGEVQVSYSHILRGNNSKADTLENQGAKLRIRSTKVKGVLSNYFYVP